jgi:S-adenosylmethionine:diacylglycerol 3-amino-3-carboxypropyl transferase
MTQRRRDRLYRWGAWSDLVFNQVWEDFELDRSLMDYGPDQVVVGLCSAGCSVLAIALCGVEKVFAVDLNPAQLHLLRLKQTSAQNLDSQSHWRLFGQGQGQDLPQLVQTLLPQLPESAARYWQHNAGLFVGGLHQAGRFGFAMRTLRRYLHIVCGGQEVVEGLFHCRSLQEQRVYLDEHVWPRWWNRGARALVASPWTLLPFGCSPGQARLMAASGRYPEFLASQIYRALSTTPLQENPLWQSALLGRYLDREHVPEHLLAQNFEALGEASRRVEPHQASITDVLRGQDRASVDRVKLGDLMDWMGPDDLGALWQSLCEVVVPGGRVLIRSASPTFSLPQELTQGFRVEVHDGLLERGRSGSYARLLCAVRESA